MLIATQLLSSTAAQTVNVVTNRLGHIQQVTPRHQDEIWVVSARNIGGTCENDTSQLEVCQWVNGNWTDSQIDELTDSHQGDQEKTTVLYVHGNQTDEQYGLTRGMQLYENLTANKSMPPIRLVLWLWKSEKEFTRLYSDFIIKSERSVNMGRCFAATLDRLGDQRMILLGFSLGAQVISSALDVLEEETYRDRESRSEVLDGPESGNGYRVALLAPAVDPQYACRVAQRKVGSTLTNRSSIFFNRSDRAIKALRILVRRACPQSSVSLPNLMGDRRLHLGTTRAIDISLETRCKHSVVNYSQSRSFQNEFRKMLGEIASEHPRPQLLTATGN